MSVAMVRFASRVGGLLTVGLLMAPTTPAQTDWHIEIPAGIPDLSGV